ncbi:MAG: DNA mismatch repair protein MutT [Bacteroidales bacterium]|nr:DNA mismatch repair protein MutT [Bacteroidales bacterium]
MQTSTVNPHVSVDCVVLGFDGIHLNALLLKRTGGEGTKRFNDLKLPGSLIYAEEDLDTAAQRVLGELFSSNAIYMRQFKSFGSPDRTGNPRDVKWLEEAVNQKIGRIVTVSYLSLIRIDDKLKLKSEEVQAVWTPIPKIQKLAFDHNQILQESLLEVRRFVTMDPALVFNLLPKKFTAAQMRILFEELFGEKMDVRNFHKKMNRMDYVVALNEYEEGVAHRAARFYRFDKKIYLKSLGGFN